MTTEKVVKNKEAGHPTLNIAGYTDKTIEEITKFLPIYATELRIKKLIQEL